MTLSLEEKKEKAKQIIEELKKLYPHPKIALNYGSPFELLVAVILSAQATDKLVNKVTENLFKKYKTLEDYVKAPLEEFDLDIHSVNFHTNKAKNILKTAKLVQEKYNGKVPDTMEELITLPGVARKTANVILGTIYGKSVGIVVDTHVRRLTNLFGLTSQNDPVKIEQDLMQIVPKEDWIVFPFLLISYGRQYCTGRPHDHLKCPLASLSS